MTALSMDLRDATARLSAEARRPLAGSEKVYVTGAHADMRVAMREVQQADTPAVFNASRKITQEVRDFARQNSLADEKAALAEGMKEKAREFREKGSDIYQEI